MSYEAAVTKIKTLLSADPISSDHSGVTLHYAPDPRVASLAEHPQGNIDGAFLLVADEPGSPYPVVQCSDPNDYSAGMRLEICTILHKDTMQQDITAEARMRAVQEVLLWNTYSEFSLYAVATPTRTRIASDRRVITTIRFRMRYVE